jgi:membrane carboxypeptidase/penicillin-binding protein PbpC
MNRSKWGARKGSLGDFESDIQTAQGNLVKATSMLDQAWSLMMKVTQVYDQVLKQIQTEDDEFYARIEEQYENLREAKLQIKATYSDMIGFEDEGRDILSS